MVLSRRSSFFNRVTAILMLAVMMVSLGSNVLHVSAATDSTKHYDSERFQVTVTWDEEVWTATPSDLGSGAEGLGFDSVSSYGQIQMVESEAVDPVDCLDQMSGVFEEDDGIGIEGFKTASSRIDRPEGIDDAEEGLYTYSLIDGDRSIDQVLFLSCSAILNGDAALQIFLATDGESYEDVVSEWEALIGGIQIAEQDESSDDDSNDEGTTSYESEAYGYRVDWDAEIWSVEELDTTDGDGIGLESWDSWGEIRGNDTDSIDAEACVEFMAETFGTGDNIDDFDNASRKLALPESNAGGEAGLFAFTIESEGETVDMLMYLECTSLGDGDVALMIMLATSLDAYEDVLPQWSDLLNGISIDDVDDDAESTGEDDSADDEDVQEPIDGSYENLNLGFVITWDPVVWTGTAFDDEDGEGVILESELAYAIVTGEESDLTAAECVEELAYQLEKNDNYKKVRKAPASMERPTLQDGMEAELFTMLDKSSPTKFVIYFVCAPAANDGVMLNARMMAISSDYETILPDLQAVVDGIDLSGGDTASDDDQGSEESAETESYTSDAFEVTVSYDPMLWEIEDHSDEFQDNIGLVSDYARISVVAYESEDDVQTCLDDLVANEGDFADGEVVIADQALARPEHDRDAAGELYAYTYVGDGGPLDVVVYLECRPLVDGESVIGIAIFTTSENYEEMYDEFITVTDSIEI